MISELLIALFGGTYYAAKLCIDHAQTKSYDRKFAEYSKTNEMMREQLLDVQLGYKIEEMLSKPQNKDMIYEIISDNLTAVFGNNYKESFIIEPYAHFYHYNQYSKEISDNFWAKHLIMSKYGKMDWNAFHDGYPVGNGSENVIATRLKICEQLEKNFQKRYPELRLFLKPNIPKKTDDWNPNGKYIALEHRLPWDTDKSKARMW